jgi:hypothetical protein
VQLRNGAVNERGFGEIAIMNERITQEEQILAHLKSGKRITPMEALNLYKCFRLGGRIYDLKKRGFIINKEMVETSGGARVAQYSMEAHRETLF